MKHYRQSNEAKALHEINIFSFLIIGCFSGFILGAFVVNIFGHSAVVFGTSFGIFIGFCVNILAKN